MGLHSMGLHSIGLACNSYFENARAVQMMSFMKYKNKYLSALHIEVLVVGLVVLDKVCLQYNYYNCLVSIHSHRTGAQRKANECYEV